jgi:hypothetical protein
MYDYGVSFEEVIVYGKGVFNIEKQVVGIMAGARKKNLVGNQLRVLIYFYSPLNVYILLLSLIMDKIGIFQTN